MSTRSEAITRDAHQRIAELGGIDLDAVRTASTHPDGGRLAAWPHRGSLTAWPHSGSHAAGARLDAFPHLGGHPPPPHVGAIRHRGSVAKSSAHAT